MKKIHLFFLMAGLMLSMFSCSNEINPVDDNDSTKAKSDSIGGDAKKDTVYIIPTLPNWNELGDEIESFVDPLIEKIPENIVSQFENLNVSWVMTWSRPEIAIHSNPRKYAQSDEYKSLLAFCKPYGKAIWPLVMRRSIHYSFYVLLMEDITVPEYLTLFEEAQRAAGAAGGFNNSLARTYTYFLIKNEESNIRKAVDSLVKP